MTDSEFNQRCARAFGFVRKKLNTGQFVWQHPDGSGFGEEYMCFLNSEKYCWKARTQITPDEYQAALNKIDWTRDAMADMRRATLLAFCEKVEARS